MSSDDQQFCLRWNNFQAYITSQFEALRDDEDFVDVTLACEGRRLGAHKVVLSACSPFFKELFKSNPCPHPIIFMRDVEVRHVVALLEFMYAGEVNVAQAQLAGFLRTAESLQIRGLTDASSRHQENDVFPDHPTSTSPSRRKNKSHSPSRGISSVSSTLTSEEPTPTKRLKPDEEPPQEDLEELNPSINPFALQTKALHTEVDISAELIEPKIEPDYTEEEEGNGFEEQAYGNLSGGMEIIPGTSGTPEASQESQQGCGSRRQTRLATTWVQRLPTPAAQSQGRTVKLGEGIEICEEQLRGVKWSDYRKLTRGLATILFSPMELATCSVTGQRWSRAGNGERPVKPALDRAKVQAIISYVATRFPMVEISRIKQVLAYKCKENSTAFKMKAIRYFGDQQLNQQINHQ